MTQKQFTYKGLLMLWMCVMTFAAVAQDDAATSPDTPSAQTVVLQHWMALPPIPVAPPLFHQIPNIRKKVYTDAELLNLEPLTFAGHTPELKQRFELSADPAMVWGEFKGVVSESTAQAQILYLATYLHADRWLTGQLELKSGVMMKAWLDGKEIETKTSIDTAGNPGKLKKSLKLERGTHLLLVKLVIPASTSPLKGFSGTVELKEPFSIDDLTNTIAPTNRKNIHHMLDGVKITGMQLSFDGSYVMVHYRRSLPPDDRSESWTEIRTTDSRKLVHSFRHAQVSQLQWLPASNSLSYVAGEKPVLYLFDPVKGQITAVMPEVAKLGGCRWSPDETFVIYSVREDPESKEEVMRHIQGMPDRIPGWRGRSFLYRYHLASGITTRLTWGNLSTSLHDISPDGRKIVFGQHTPDFTTRPYSKQHLFLMDLETLTLDTLFSDNPWGVSVTFSPDGTRLLATGGPEAFGRVGVTISEDLIPHNSDIQVYLYDLQTRNVSSITRNFNPSVNSVFWHPVNQQLYLWVTEEDYRNLYRYDMAKEQFSRISTGVEYITSVDFANRGLRAVFAGNQANRWPAWHLLDLKTLKVTPFEDPEAETYRHVEFGEVKNWDFTATSGVTIKGRVYYPPGFDPARTYPVIVYYYGGINPVGRTFAGRYPFNLWAGHNYLVYVLQPSGAVGFGQEFSAAHVNNWGITVADEIIEGTKKFLSAHPFADPTKVGCAGASYGGFMTMLLLTRTDLFAAAISHAGISSISSYWGEGYWGYAYSAGASAFSFPWNNQELYIGQSPLFHADKVTTPLLLITGDKDTNVPPGESIQMYTALKLLGRPVELVMVKGEDHHIVTYSKRILWHNTLMAWWDKHLKAQPEWWKELYE
jgi:dipeptidyl aminopeptidase/acylaminoacyl peptidase